MSYSVGAVRRWDARGVTTACVTSACVTSAGRHHIAEEARGALSEGRHGLAMGWEGVAADTVLDAADSEHRHIDALAGYLDDLTQTLEQAGNALGPAVMVVRDRIAEAQARGLVALEDSLAPAAGRDEITQAEVDGHAEAIEEALDIVASLDQL